MLQLGARRPLKAGSHCPTGAGRGATPLHVYSSERRGSVYSDEFSKVNALTKWMGRVLLPRFQEGE